MLTLLLFILILSVLVVIHEFGHFYVAKKAGVRVEEFGFGLPPRVLGKKIGETLYSINLLPFGGFVKLAGEDELDENSYEVASKDPRNFMSKSVLQRSAIVLAGIVMNSVLAIVLYYVFFMFTGFKSLTIPNFFDYRFRFGVSEEINTVVLGYTGGSSVESLVSVGEAIIEVDGKPVYSVSEIRESVKYKANQDVNLLLMNVSSMNREIRSANVKPTPNDAGEGVLGVFIGEATVLNYSRNKFLSGPMHAYNILAYSKFTLGRLVGESVSQRSVEPVSASVSGPVGIMSVVGGILDQSSSISSAPARFKTIALSLIDLTALLSVSLAFINAIPFPALDGGRLAFILLEGIRGKRVSPKYEVAFHQAGMILLLGLLVMVTIRDVARIF